MTVPLFLALSLLGLAILPLALLLASLVDLALADRSSLPRSRAVLFFALYLACELSGIVAAAAVWFALLGGRAVGHERYLAANAALQRVWASALLFGALRIYSMRLVVEGSESGQRGPVLFFVRHSSTADTVLVAAVIAGPHRLQLRYVLKRELLWDPCLDIVGLRLPNAFIDRASARSEEELEAIAQLGRGLDESSGVLIYPEGTRYSEPKRVAAIERLRTRGQGELADIAAGYRSVLPPRTGGPLALLSAATDADVIFVEHVGLEGAASFSQFWRGALVGQTLRVRLRRILSADIPALSRERWLFEQWRETDNWITTSSTQPAVLP